LSQPVEDRVQEPKKSHPQLAQVLAGGDEEVLDDLFPQAAPAGSLESVIVGGVGEASLHPMLAAFAIGLSRFTARLPPALVEQSLLLVAVNRSPHFIARAGRSQAARRANLPGPGILPVVARGMMASPVQPLVGRAHVGVGFFVVVERLRWKDLFQFPVRILTARQIGHVGGEAFLLRGHEVRDGAVRAVGDDSGGTLSGDVSVLFDQGHHSLAFVDAAGRRFHRRDHAALVLHRAVRLVARTGSLVALADHRCLRVGRAAPARLGLLESRGGLRTDGRNLLGAEFAHGLQRGIGVNQAAVEVDPARIHQTRLHALPHHPFEEPLKNLHAPLAPRLG